MLDNALAEVLPALVGFGVGFGGGGVEDVGGAEVGPKFLGDDGPAHQFRDGEEFDELGFGWNEAVAGVGVDAVEEVGLFVVVSGEDDVIDNSLEDLRRGLVNVYIGDKCLGGLRHVVARDFPLLTRYRGHVGSAYTPPSTCRRASPG